MEQARQKQCLTDCTSDPGPSANTSANSPARDAFLNHHCNGCSGCNGCNGSLPDWDSCTVSHTQSHTGRQRRLTPGRPLERRPPNPEGHLEEPQEWKGAVFKSCEGSGNTRKRCCHEESGKKRKKRQCVLPRLAARLPTCSERSRTGSERSRKARDRSRKGSGRQRKPVRGPGKAAKGQGKHLPTTAGTSAPESPSTTNGPANAV